MYRYTLKKNYNDFERGGVRGYTLHTEGIKKIRRTYAIDARVWEVFPPVLTVIVSSHYFFADYNGRAKQTPADLRDFPCFSVHTFPLPVRVLLCTEGEREKTPFTHILHIHTLGGKKLFKPPSPVATFPLFKKGRFFPRPSRSGADGGIHVVMDPGR